MIDYDEFILRTGLNVRPIGNKYNTSCPSCGDKKKRLWFLLAQGGGRVVTCFNGGCEYNKPTSLQNFLLNEFPSLGEELKSLERYKFLERVKRNKNVNRNERERKTFDNSTKINKGKDILFVPRLNKDIFQDIYSKPEAVEYLRNRNIPEEIFKNWYYVPEDLDLEYNFAGNIVIPLKRNSDNKFYGFTSRSISQKKFIIQLFSEEAYKVYNLYNVDLEKEVYIFESVFDSLYIENSIACCGAAFPDELLESIKNPVFCFDYDETGLNSSLYYARNGFKVFLIPERFQKEPGTKMDINDIVKTFKLSETDVRKMITGNIYPKGMKTEIHIKQLLRKNRWKLSSQNKKF
jgi:hypothetical protein